MAISAILTTAGLYNYRNDLFDNLLIPAPPTVPALIGLQADQLRAAWTINRSDLADYICLKAAGLSLVYPDADFMKQAISVWSKAHSHEWQRLFDTLFYKYNPMWNKDGKIQEDGRDSPDITTTYNKSYPKRDAGTTTMYTHGYDAVSNNTVNWAPADKIEHDNSITEGETGTTRDAGTTITSLTRTEQGNIGVTSTQELISQERDLAMWSFDDYIANEYIKEFCVMVY